MSRRETGISGRGVVLLSHLLRVFAVYAHCHIHPATASPRLTRGTR